MFSSDKSNIFVDADDTHVSGLSSTKVIQHKVLKSIFKIMHSLPFKQQCALR